MKFTILGLGSIGTRHLNNLRAMGHEVAYYDPARGHDAHFRANVVVNSDAVVICSPNTFHLTDLRFAVVAGKHAFVEKPIATNLPLARQFVADAEERGLVVFTGYNLRFHASVQKAREWLPEIGKILWASVTCASYLPDWVPEKDYKTRYSSDPKDGGCIFDISHEIDLALYLLGPAHVVTATARTDLLGLDCDSMADFVLRHDNGATSTHHYDYVTKPPIRATTIVGENGQIVIDLLARWTCMTMVDGQRREHQAYDNFDENYVVEMMNFTDRIERIAIFANDWGASGADGLAAAEIAIDVRSKAGLP